MLNNSDFDDDTVLAGGPGAYEYWIPSFWQGSGTVALVSSYSPDWQNITAESGEQFVALQNGNSYLQQQVYVFSNSLNYDLTFYAMNMPSSTGELAPLDVNLFLYL